MGSRSVWFVGSVLIWASGLWLAPGQAMAQTPTAPPAAIAFSPGERLDSELCGRCHVDIYEAWRGSVHAQSYRDPVFQHGLAQAVMIQGPRIAETCLTCHSPATVMLDRQYPQQAPEGVNCQFCHILRGAHADRFPPFDIDRELTMYGPYGDADSPVHATVASSFLQSAEYCASCHEYTTPAGGAVLSTFTEYGSGGYPKLAECQACHMPLVLGLTVDPTVSAPGRSPFIDFHGIEGGRDINQLRRAVSVEIVSAKRNGESVAVEVAIENRAAGHFLPTGMPSRRMILQISTQWQEHIESRSIVFGRRILDSDNNPLTSVAEMMLFGAKVVNDTRLRPHQRKVVGYTLSAPMGVETTLRVRLYYESTELPTEPPVTADVVHLVQRVQ